MLLQETIRDLLNNEIYFDKSIHVKFWDDCGISIIKYRSYLFEDQRATATTNVLKLHDWVVADDNLANNVELHIFT